MWPEIGGLVSPSLLLVAKQQSSIQIFHFAGSVWGQIVRNGCVKLLPPFKKGSTLMIKPKECPQRGKAVKDESSQPPPPPSVLQGSLFSAVSFPKPLRACASLGASPRGSQWAPAGVRRGRGLQERSSSPPTCFSFPSLVYPAWVGFVLWRTPK